MSGQSKAGLGDIILPIAVVTVVGMMIFPLPSAMLDVLLMCNIAFSLTLLATAVYQSEPERFTALPSTLLLATLFRLGLNISTTRQLLGTGEAPDVVVAFGSFVVGGNLIVGAVVFAIVTLVQFLVIAKGAERVAEVAARFVLDAMPGKQMSIDADIRAGMCSLAEAREKRRALHRESKLYGALDGAMKFVKGDAIAGLLITLINISAGLIVGITQQGLSLSAALQKYTLFTVGDGLVSQIPALLVAVAAGISVTRVGDKDDSFLGRDIVVQLTREPQSILTVGFVLLALSIVPGLPTLSFIALGTLLLVLAASTAAKNGRREREGIVAGFKPKVYSAILLSLSPDAAVALQKECDFAARVQSLRNSLFEKWGVFVPDVQFEVKGGQEGIAVDIFLHGARMSRLSEASSALARPDEGSDGAASRECEDRKCARQLGNKIVLILEQMICSHLVEFVNDTQTRVLLEIHRPIAEDLVNSVVPEMVSVTCVTAILRQLVRERVPVRNLNCILQAIAEYHLRRERGDVMRSGEGGEDELLLAEMSAISGRSGTDAIRMPELLAEVRIALGRAITRSMTNERWELRAWILDESLDLTLSRIALSGSPIDPEFMARILESVESGTRDDDGGRTVILTSRHARAILFGIVSERLKHISVIAKEELCSEAVIVSRGLIGVSLAEREEYRESEEFETAILSGGLSATGEIGGVIQ